MKRPSRRTMMIASISAAVVVVLVAAILVVLSMKADTDARSSYDEARAALVVAMNDRNTARRDLGIAQDSAALRAQNGMSLVTIDPALLADSATIDRVQSSTTSLIESASLVESDGTVSAPPALPRIVEAMGAIPSDRDGLTSAAATLRDRAKILSDEATALTAELTIISTTTTELDAATTAVAASAFAFGSSATPPERASADSVTAYTAALAALENPPADTDVTALVLAYRNAWNATVASDAAARSDSGAAAPTYINGILIVNKTYGLPSTFGNGLTTETTNAFAAMQADAAAAGHNIYIASGFRSFASQKSIYNRYVASEGQDGADRHSARPGHSEHQSGLTFDLNSITTAFGSTPEGIWVRDNAHKYGFIVRYPPGKEAITGYVWEPWHLRYLGTTVATELFNSGETLEEYLGVTSVYS